MPSWKEIALQIKLGAIGKPRFLNFMHSKSCYQQREKFYSNELAGGMLTSLGQYPLAFAYMIFKGQEPIEINASGCNFMTGVDKSHSVTLFYENGEVLTSFISCGKQHLIIYSPYSNKNYSACINDLPRRCFHKKNWNTLKLFSEVKDSVPRYDCKTING